MSVIAVPIRTPGGGDDRQPDSSSWRLPAEVSYAPIFLSKRCGNGQGLCHGGVFSPERMLRHMAWSKKGSPES